MIDVTDRFGDHGLVGAAIVLGDEILGLAMSCRVLGMGVEHTFMQHILAEMKKSSPSLTGRIIETPRNSPVRNIYRDNGFSESEPGSLDADVLGCAGKQRILVADIMRFAVFQ